MPQSLSKVILHIIFSTKNREPWLDYDMQPRMHAYLATICRDLGTEFVRVGVLLITFTSSRRCREHFPKPS
jgi:putative transposase